MRVLRSGRALPEPQLKTLISSSDASSPSITDTPLNTSEVAAPAPVANSRSLRSLPLPSNVPSPVTVAADEGGSKRKRSSRVSVAGSSYDAREERLFKLRSRSRVSQRRFSTGSDLVEKQDDVVGSFKEGGLVDGVEGMVDVIRGKVDDGFEAMKLPSGDLVQSVDRHLELGEKTEAYDASRKDIGYMSLRSGSRVPRIRIGDGCVDSVLISEHVDRLSCREVKKVQGFTPHCESIEKYGDEILINVGGMVSEGANCLECIKMKDGLVAEEDRLDMAMSGIFLGDNGIDDGVSSSKSSKIGFCNREDKGMEKMILEDSIQTIVSEDDLNVDRTPEGLHEKRPIGDGGTYQRRSRRYSREEKGKEKLAPKELEVGDGEQVTSQDVEFTSVNGSGKPKIGSSQGKSNSRREAARNTAIELAPQFAFFKAEEERSEEEAETDDSIPDANEEDWPGPFSTAMKIIAESKIKAHSLNLSSLKDGGAEVKIPWTPSNVRRHMTMGNIAPSLKDLCLKVLCENAEEIESLEGLPDAIKHNISMLLCHSRRMSSRFLGLLTKGSPVEIYLSDCSWATDKLFEELFSQCNITNLKVLCSINNIFFYAIFVLVDILPF